MRYTLDEVRSKLSGLHFAKECLTPGERELLLLAEAILREVDQAAGGYAREFAWERADRELEQNAREWDHWVSLGAAE